MSHLCIPPFSIITNSPTRAQGAGARLVKLVNRALREADMPPGTIENVLDVVDSLVNPSYATPATKAGVPERGSGRSPGTRGPVNRTGRRSGFPLDGVNSYSAQGGFPFAPGGPISLGGSSPPNLGVYGFHTANQMQQAGQAASLPWRGQTPGQVDRQTPRLVQIFIIDSSKGPGVTSAPLAAPPLGERAQGPTLPVPPPSVSSPTEKDRVEDPILPPPSPGYSEPNPVYLDLGEGKESETESDSGSGCQFPGECSQHPTQQHNPPEPSTSPHTPMRAQGLVRSRSAPATTSTTIVKTFDVIIIDG